MDSENSIDLHAPTEISPSLDRECITFMASMLNAGDVCDITLGYSKQTLANIAAVLTSGVVCTLSQKISTTKLMVFIRHLSSQIYIVDHGQLSVLQHKHICQSAQRHTIVNTKGALKQLPMNLPQRRSQGKEKSNGHYPPPVSSQTIGDNSQQTTYQIMMMANEAKAEYPYSTNNDDKKTQIDFDQLGWRAVDQMMAQHVDDPFLCDVEVAHHWQDGAVDESDDDCVSDSDYIGLFTDPVAVVHTHESTTSLSADDRHDTWSKYSNKTK